MTGTAFFDRLSRPLLTALAFVLVVVLGWIDYITGLEYSVSLFYLIPVFISAWYVGKGVAVAVAFAGAASWLIAELALRYQHEDTVAHIYWNDIVELGFFLVVAYVLSALKTALDHERSSARTDPLTGIANRRHFYDAAENEIKRLERYGDIFTVAYIDIDNFKTINDRFGHSKGDELLRLMAGIMKSHIRATDTAARIGGDEFALLLPETGDPSALAAVRKIKEALDQVVREKDWPVSLSSGVVTYYAAPASVDKMLEQIDGLMYSVKREGKGMIRHQAVYSKLKRTG
jgi:diguanylate cyclase (GGDEF)-like protein